MKAGTGDPDSPNRIREGLIRAKQCVSEQNAARVTRPAGTSMGNRAFFIVWWQSVALR